ncbi:MAG: methionine synthase [Candidatus Thermoplasmatota archaeon]
MTALEDALKQRILLLDGGMGTMLQVEHLTADDYGGAQYEGCPEQLNLTRPDIVRGIHEKYYAAGADIVETNTFGGASIVLAEYGLALKAREINKRAAEIAREAAQAVARQEALGLGGTPTRGSPQTPLPNKPRFVAGARRGLPADDSLVGAATNPLESKPRFVAGSIGPTTKTITVTGGVTFDTLKASYREQAEGLLEGGVDCLLVETSQDTLNVKAAALGIEEAFVAQGKRVPLMLSATIEPMGTMLAGQSVDAFYAAVEHFHPLTVGLNCATGPEFMTDHLRTLAGIATCPVHVYPNAGLPDSDGRYEETPESLARKMQRFVDEGLVNIVGGCCGTTPAHIAALARVIEGKRPRSPQMTIHRHVSGIEYLEITGDASQRPILVGERTNVIGSRKFKRLVAEGKWEEASEVGRAQVKNGAQVVDVCLADPDRDEKADVLRFLPELNKKVKAPLMIDSTDASVIELALKHSQGKAIINSINLEDGEERFEKVLPLVKQYGAAVVVGCIDEDKQQGMAVTRARKLAIAERSYMLLTQQYGIAPGDIIFDPLVFPCGTGDHNYRASAIETIEGVRLITQRFPECSTILGISNVSFGLPTAGREVLNSVFLHDCVQAGLTFAIVNSEALERYPNIPEADRRVCEDVLRTGGDESVSAFAHHFGNREEKTTKSSREGMPLDARLSACIIEGTKEGLRGDLDLALKDRKPLDIINGPLMAGMTEVGRLFNANELIVAEVLQSAEAMKAAVDHLKPHMERVSDQGHKGKIVLATVKGDVHDIGKNLVEIILSNNGYDVVNLGIKVPPEDLVRAVKEHKPDAIGLSGLLVKSAQQMAITASDLRNAGISLPLLVGGAALTKRFTATRIKPEYQAPTFYAKDAMQGLAIANAWFSDDRGALLARTQNDYDDLGAARQPTVPESARFEAVARVRPLPQAPDFERHVLRDVDARAIFQYVNPVMLYGKHLGLRGDVAKLIAAGDEKALELHAFVEALKDEVVRGKLLHLNATWCFFPAQSDGEALLVYDPRESGKVLERFTFPRQQVTPQRSISDWVEPVTGQLDSVAFFTVTAGPGVREIAQAWKERGEFLKSHAIQALAIESAEGFAEYVHKRIREAWGIPDKAGLGLRDLFQANYTGLRVSFGYPACPDLSDQQKLWRLLHPDDIGVQLTDGFMMDPEASVSALVFHHPDAKYFDAR